MMEANKFFSTSERVSIFEGAVSRLRLLIDRLADDHDATQRYMLEFVGTVFNTISNAPELFDELCPLNIESLGERYVSSANNVSKGGLQDLEFLFSTSFRFLIEYQLASKTDLSPEFGSLMARVHDYSYDGQTASQIRYAEHQMIINVLQRYLHHTDMVHVRALPEAMRQSETMRNQYEAELKSREERVVELKSKLDTYKTAFNFVGLYDGFKSLRKKKGREAWWGRFCLMLLGLVMLAPFLGKFYSVFHALTIVHMDTAFYVSLFGFELLLAYFFRVALQGYKSVQAQLIQIDLRMTLCQFIQDYADYAKEVRRDSPQLLERFDQLVFSGIVSNEGAIPSTFDGVEQIANLIDKIKPK
ncbi:hypothetical protein [Pseudomonas syringae]|uniref:hypothetical protein n=1 Tax=Pseudomonas syringae TaxID=317 RepID=UPI00040432B5|nr:hypothetical protein [Pseudomonas syringae]UOF22005.1 hypothetical protein N023_11040 [Pseudomonas syringae CC440]UZA79588.1 hypothetical protein EZZ79_11525 [Pseudomonas syringae]